MGAGHSAEDGGAYASDPPANERKKTQRRRRHSVDSVASYSSQNHVDRIRTQNFSAASCQDEGDFGSIKTSLFRRSSSSNLEYPHKRPESVISNTSSTRSRLREFVERKSNQDEHKSAANTVGDIQYFENPSETLEFDRPRNSHSLESKKSTDERPKKRKLSKSKDKDKDKEKDLCESKNNKKHEKYQSKLAEYYKLPVQLPQDEFYQHLTRSKAAEDLLQKRFSNSDAEFSSSYGRLCKHKEPEPSNLRRSRSLAVIREETFTDLQIQNNAKSKRSQLIPRARLFDKPCFKDRLPGRAKYQTKEEVLESIYIDSTASCFGDINAHRESDSHIERADNKSEKEDTVSHNISHNSRSVSGSWPNLNEDSKNTLASEGSLSHSRNPSEIDSLDSNYVRKHYNFAEHLKNYKESSPETERSAVSPDQSKDLYITDDHNTDNDERIRSKINTPKSFTNDSLSITHSEKDKTVIPDHIDDIDSYDEVSLNKNSEENNIELKTDPKTTGNGEGDIKSVVSENDGSVSSPPDSITSYISISIASSTDKSHKLEYLANSLAEKIDEYCDSQFQENTSVVSQVVGENNLQENDPIYTQVSKKKTFADIRRDSFLNKKGNGNLFNEIVKKPSSETYISNTFIDGDNFSTKSNYTSSKNITTEPFVTTLIENQYYSLPDINISKCLRKSERIDAQLREEDPEDIPCENTYEIAQTHFREILCSKGTENYGQLNKTTKDKVTSNNNYYITDHTDSQIIQNFSKLEDDLKSIITIESSNPDDVDESYYRTNTHQNEREINEIEGTIRNNKLITKSESLKITADSRYRPNNHISKSLSNDNINTLQQKKRTGIRKHYSLRQRDPIDDDLHRIPSPDTVEKSLNKKISSIAIISPLANEIKNSPLVSRVQSFKTTSDSNIAIIPLSGHQTIVIDPPLDQNFRTHNSQPNLNFREETKIPVLIQNKIPKLENRKISNFKTDKIATDEVNSKKIDKNNKTNIDTSSYYTPKDPFITIKLNKVVKTTLPKLKTGTYDKIDQDQDQHKLQKPPPRLIIKDTENKKTTISLPTVATNMSRPQILQVKDSKSKPQINPLNKINIESHTTDNNKSIENKEEPREFRVDITARDKLHNAIKTDIEYQEKINSVKNYWSKLADSPENKENAKQDIKDETLENSYIENNSINEDNDKQKEDAENNSTIDVSVGNIIKSLESVKIVDSIRKISQSKIQLWKDETEKVKSDSEIEETTLEKKPMERETTTYEKPKTKQDIDLCRDTPEIEIVELSSDDNKNLKTQATLIKAKGFEKGCDEFDHVRYKVMKSELFKNSMIANYRKEAQFDGLLQYLQEYSFQELLVNNNIVIIEPVRTKIEPVQKKNNTDTCRIVPTLLKKSENSNSLVDKSKNAIRRHFFYHPIRVNKEIIEEELPNPDTVKKVRNLFEDTLKMKSPMTHDPPLLDEHNGLTRRATSYRNLSEEVKGSKIGGRKKVIRQLTIDTNFGHKKWDNASLSSGVSSGDLSSNNEYDNDNLSPYSHKNLKDNVYSSSDEYLCDSMSQDFCCESQYVSPDILKKIRECGTTITYYGGKVLNSKSGSTVSPMTKAIMEEIKSLQKNCSRDCYSCQSKCKGEKCTCLIANKHKQMSSPKQSTTSEDNNVNQDKSETFPGFKFKLVKSNSCSSRLELTGTDDNKNPRYKFRKQARTDDPPLVYDDENSVKNKICRLESYNKGIVNTPFENKDNEDFKEIVKSTLSVKKINEKSVKKVEIVAPQPQQNLNTQNNIIDTTTKEEEELKEATNNDAQIEKQTTDNVSFEKKFYYVNDSIDQMKTPSGKFGEMVFEEFEVLESCYDSLNSNKSLK